MCGSDRKSFGSFESEKPMKHILLILLASLFLPACVPALTPIPVTATFTLTPKPTLTPTPAPTSTITPTPTPSLPADFPQKFQDQLADKQVDQLDTDQDGNIDKITDPASGETLFQLDAQSEWQRMITFTLENGDKMEMARFETPEEAYNYMLKNGIAWKATWGTRDLENTPEKSDFWLKKFHELAITRGVGMEFAKGLFISNDKDLLTSHIKVHNWDDDAVIIFLTVENNLQAIYVDEDASIVYAWMPLKRQSQ